MTKIHLPVRVEKEVLEQIKNLAKQDNRTVSGYVNNVLTDHIKEGYDVDIKRKKK